MAKFAFYSTDIDPTTDPASADPQPESLIILRRDPIAGEYNPIAGDMLRGSVIRTLGGAVFQEFDAQEEDQVIKISDNDALTQSNVDGLKTMASTGEWYFTDGYDVWKVKFSRPRGFVYKRNIMLAHSGKTVYDYEMELIPLWKSGES